mgnify:CR=1 FL=1
MVAVSFFSKKAPVLVTGGSGLVGRALVEELRHQGYESVISLSRRDCDLLDPESVLKTFARTKPKLIFHLAARVFGLGGNGKFKSDVLVENVRINTNVIEAARAAKVEKIVAMGSGCVYPEFPSGEPLLETQVWDGPPHPSEDSYGHSKRLMLAHLVASREQYGTNFAYAVSGNIYGQFDNFDPLNGHVTPSLVAKFYEAKNKGTPVSVWGTGAAVRDFTHSKDAARALVLMMEQTQGVMNLGSGERRSIRDLVQVLANHTGVDVIWDDSKPDGQLKRVYDLGGLAQLGFLPETSFEDGIRQTYDWYAENFPNVRR